MEHGAVMVDVPSDLGIDGELAQWDVIRALAEEKAEEMGGTLTGQYDRRVFDLHDPDTDEYIGERVTYWCYMTREIL